MKRGSNRISRFMIGIATCAVLGCTLIGCDTMPQRGMADSKTWKNESRMADSMSDDHDDGDDVGDGRGGPLDPIRGIKKLVQNTPKPRKLPDAKDSTIQTASAESPSASAPNSDDAVEKPQGELAESIVARVNGDVILAQTLFAPLRGRLAEAQTKMQPVEFAQFRGTEIKRQLNDLIERQLLIQEARRQLPEQLVKKLEGAADREFSKTIDQNMKKMGVNTEAELRHKMLDEGMSLEQVRENQRAQFAAQQFLLMQLGPRIAVSRPEMLDYYNAHPEQFKKPVGVRWSEIVISFEKQGSREAARNKADEVLAKLRGGSNFATLAKADSDGATAAQGGAWDFTTQRAYVVKAVDEVIFRLPEGKFSDLIEGPRGWHIVRVDQKDMGGIISFVDAQDEIRKLVREEKFRKETAAYVEQLRKKAHIVTIFDGTPSAVQQVSGDGRK